MAKFFESNEYKGFTALLKILGFAEDPKFADYERQRQFDKRNLNMFIDSDGLFRLYKGGRALMADTCVCMSAEGLARLDEASQDKLYKTLEAWLASRVTAAATYRRLAAERLEAAQKDLAQFAGLEAALERELHDLRKTTKIVEEGHQ